MKSGRRGLLITDTSLLFSNLNNVKNIKTNLDKVVYTAAEKNEIEQTNKNLSTSALFNQRVINLLTKTLSGDDILDVISVALWVGYNYCFSSLSTVNMWYFTIQDFLQVLVYCYISQELKYSSTANSRYTFAPDPRTMSPAIISLIAHFVSFLGPFIPLIKYAFPSCMNNVTGQRGWKVGISLRAFSQYVSMFHTRPPFVMHAEASHINFRSVVDFLYAGINSGSIVNRLVDTVSVYDHTIAIANFILRNQTAFSALTKKGLSVKIEMPSSARYDTHVRWARVSFYPVRLTKNQITPLTSAEAQFMTDNLVLFPFIFCTMRYLELESITLVTMQCQKESIRIPKLALIARAYSILAMSVRNNLVSIPREELEHLMNSRTPVSISVMARIFWLEAMCWYYASTYMFISGDYFKGCVYMKGAQRGLRRQLGHDSVEYMFFMIDSVQLVLSNFQFYSLAKSMMRELDACIITKSMSIKDKIGSTISTIKQIAAYVAVTNFDVIRVESINIKQWSAQKL